MNNVKPPLDRVALTMFESYKPETGKEKRLYLSAAALSLLLIGGVARAKRSVPAIGQGLQQGYPEIPEFIMRTIVAGAWAAQIAKGTGSGKFSAQRSADAPNVHRQSSSARRQQNVRMWNDSVISSGTRN